MISINRTIPEIGTRIFSPCCIHVTLKVRRRLVTQRSQLIIVQSAFALYIAGSYVPQRVMPKSERIV